MTGLYILVIKYISTAGLNTGGCLTCYITLNVKQLDAVSQFKRGNNKEGVAEVLK